VADYAVPLSGLSGNVLYTADGGVWVNFLLTGINVNPYNPAKVAAAQSLNDELFTSLSSVGSRDFLILGIKAQDRPEDVMSACVRGIPDLTSGEYPELVEQYNVFYRKILSGELAQFRRSYWLSVSMPRSRSLTDRFLSKIVVSNPHEGLSTKAVREFNESVYRSIPAYFKPVPTTPEHIRWVFDRARLRGLEVPFEPKVSKAPMKFSHRSFPQIVIDNAAETKALYEQFVEDMSERVGEKGVGVLKSHARSTLTNNFRSMHRGKMMSVANPETRNADFPDGYKSYQVMMGISAAPNTVSTALNSFTYLVDQSIGVDADFALRFHFDDEVISKRIASKAMGDLKSENEYNSRDEFDVDDYAETMKELLDLRASVKSEANPVGMKVTALFAFAHPDMNYLERRAAALTKTFANNGFTTYQAVGGQWDMWSQMLPGVRRSALTEDLELITTSYMFSGCLPLRRTVAGDSQGVPIAVNTENALGQIVLWDVLNATDKGNASVAVCGAQGAGKSYLIKEMLGYMLDLNRYVYVIDQHRHGEYEVFASTLTNTTVFDVTGWQASMDPLKVYPSEDGTASQVFMDLWLPLLGLQADSEEAILLARLLQWDNRKPRKLFSTRAFIEYIRHKAESGLSKELSGKFEFWGTQPYCAALIDPLDRGVALDLPPFDTDARCVVFRTHKLSVYRGTDLREAEPSERYAAVVYNAIAKLAAYRFSQIKGACAFFGDELHFLDGNDRVLDRLIRTPDRTGRKDGNFVVAGSQLASDYGSQYDLIKRKFTLRQETRDNSIEALEWAEVPPTEYQVSRMLEDTSPPDPDNNNLPMLGREGEGWYNDGSGNIIRIKVLPHLREDRGRMADTTSSRMVRAEELGEETA
jgi:hypothetical protein